MKKIAKLIGAYLNLLAWLSPGTAARKGFWIFCTPIAPPVKPHHQQFFDSGEKKVIELDGIRIQTYRWGNGDKTFVFLHGWQSHSFRWKAYIEAFVKQGYSVYALDAPAHGNSSGKYINLEIYARVIEQFLSTVQPVEAVISHSFGSFAALYALHRTPALRVGRLVIMGTPGEGNDFIQYYRGVLGLSERAMKLIEGYFVKAVGHPPEYFSAPAFAGTLNIPGLIVHDEQDDETPFRYALQIHRAWKGSTLLATTGLGHNLKSDDVMKKVVEFVGEKVHTLESFKTR